MAHKTLVGGTAYEISGGKTLVNGTAYSIKNGKTLVGGTAYDIGWTKYYTVTGRGRVGGASDYSDSAFDDTCAYATINSVKYTSAFDVPIDKGTQISLKVSASHSDQQYRCYVTLNGTTVQSGAGTYYFTPTNDCQITFVQCIEFVNWTLINWWYATITM